MTRIPRAINVSRFSIACSLAALSGDALAQTWIEMGPGIIEGGQVEGIAAQNNPVYGAVKTVAVHPTDSNVMLLGSINGGVWRTNNATASNPSWTPVTDFLPSLSIGALEFDRADQKTIFAGTGNNSAFFGLGGNQFGVFVSHDTGATWAPVPGNAPLSNPGINVSDIVADGALIFVTAVGSLTNQFSDAGIFRSKDGGATFQHLSGAAPGLPNVVVSSFVADPTDASRFYAACYNSNVAEVGIYRTEDAGTTWSRVTSAAIDALLSSVDNIRLAVNKNGTLFAGISDSGQVAGIFRSQDHGATFNNFGIPTTTEGNPPVTFGINPLSQAYHNFSFLAHPTNDDVLFVGGDAQPIPPYLYDGAPPNSIGANDFTGRLFRSTAPGVWTPLTHAGTANNSAPHSDSRSMAFDLSGNIVETDDGGVYRRSAPTTNAGDWTSLGGAGAGGIRVTEMYSIAYDNHGHIVLAGTQDNGTIEQTAPGAPTWVQLAAGDSGEVRVFDSSPTANSFRYSSRETLLQFQRREYSPLGTPAAPPAFSALHVMDTVDKTLSNLGGLRFDANVFVNTTFAVNQVNPSWLIFGTKSLYESTDYGENVIALGGVTNAGGAPQFNDGIDNDRDGTVDEADEMRPQLVFGDIVRTVAYGGFKNGIGFPDVLYAAAGGELRIRRAGGGVGNIPSINSAYTAAAGTASVIRALTLAAKDWETAFVGDITDIGDRVFWTFDGGVSWSQIPGLYPMDGGFLRTLAEAEIGSVRALFAGSENGVFWTLDDGSGFGPWSEFGAGSLPNAPVRELEYDPIDDVLVVATLGRGAWEVPALSSYLIVPEPSAASLLLAAATRMIALRRRKQPPH